ncbi:MAG: type IV pilus modification protein PilV [Burkholderiaceae bacterium]|jgi:type IV pilus assembly protein PilV|nr:type IV pilus modification protein PilV [Burkholderiaceae bacterium]
MQKMKPMIPAPRQRQRGLTLVEALVAMVVAAVGVLGIVGAQIRTLADTQTAVRRSQAILLIEDLSERLRINPNSLAVLSSAAAGKLTSGWNATPAAAVDCRTTGCTPEQLNAFDLKDWKSTVGRVLPLGDANIFIAPGETAIKNRRLLGVMISWRENEESASDAYKKPIDATQIQQADGTPGNGGGEAASCPENRICHLQYIAVAAH